MTRQAAEKWWNLPINESYFIEKGLKPPDRSKRFIAAKEVSYYKKDNRDNKWIPVTWSEVFKERKKKQEIQLHRKRQSYDHEYIKPVIVHCFDNARFTFFSGMYVVISSVKMGDVYLNFRRDGVRDDLMLNLMELFPFCLPGIEFQYLWIDQFIKKFRTKEKRRPEGKTIVWAKIKGGRIESFFIK